MNAHTQTKNDAFPFVVKRLTTSLCYLIAGGADSVPLLTAETIILVYFGKGYTKEVKKDKHLIPLCREFQLKNIKSKEKNDLIMLLAKQLLTRKKVTLEKNADFYCLHRDSVIVQ